ncbi:MAG: hypothetical protein GXO23_01035 [Crenarchaeota archaeon]|nr:hypothetical protein [Thermoproteota archaeon]
MSIYVEDIKKLGTVKVEGNTVKVFTSPENLREVIRNIRDSGYDTILAITVIDAPHRGKMILRYVLGTRSLERSGRAVVYVGVRRDRAEVPTICDIYPFADYLERECFEMYGVRFSGNERCRGTFFLDRSLEGRFPHRKL